MRIIHNVGYREHNNLVFKKPTLIELHDLMEFQKAQILYKGQKNQFSNQLQKIFNGKHGGIKQWFKTMEQSVSNLMTV